MSADMPVFELRFHPAMPGWCKIIGLQIKPVPECEGGGYKIPETQARRIVATVNACAGIPTEVLENGFISQMLEALEKLGSRYPTVRELLLIKAKGESP